MLSKVVLIIVSLFYLSYLGLSFKAIYDPLYTTNVYYILIAISRMLLLVFILFNLWSKNLIGWILHLVFSVFSLISIICMVINFLNPITILATIGLPLNYLIFFSAFNIFCIIYYLIPQVSREYFTSDESTFIYSPLNETDNNEDDDVINTEMTDNISNLTDDPTLSYLEFTKIKVYSTNEDENIKSTRLLEFEIDNNIPLVIKQLHSLLPLYESNGTISTETFNYFYEHFWTPEQIKLGFMKKAADHCEDIRTESEKESIGCIKIVNQEELLWFTNELMKNWLEDSTQDISFLLKIK